eukprot:Hpha_TRINITY_DN30578_c0_g1::TRINITY_DN30578_c0_g1_i1::g.193750::m.193750/K12830/SF3B3, SAP130, RSE1; splicing factor 3B subunit 3
MHLYNITLERPGAVVCSCYGSFSAPKQQELVVGRGSCVELLRLGESRQLVSHAVTDVFGIVRSLQPFRLDGQTKDHLIVGSDSGRIVILDFDNKSRKWVKIHQETFGRSGCRRAVPGQYLAVDPRGRATMIGAIEKQKFVYILSRDTDGRPSISSPLEAHKSSTVTYALVGLDPGYANPIFAALEVDHSEMDEDAAVDSAQKSLVLYELDLGLYHVVRKRSVPVEQSAHHLIAVPGGEDGPGGVIVCSNNYVTYIHESEQHAPVKQVIPRRQDMLPEQGLMTVSSVLCYPRKNMTPFFIIQSEFGDLYKLSLTFTADKTGVRQLRVRYFDTVPVANALSIFRSGYLFVAAEFGDHRLYQFLSLGEDGEDDSIVGVMTIANEGASESEQEVLPLFNPRPLKNLAPIDSVESLAPILGLKSTSGQDGESRKLYTLCGRGAGSSIRVLEHGLNLAELAVSSLPGVPEKVWTVRKKLRSKTDDYIVVSFLNATIVLSVGESVEEVTDSGFWGASSTLVVRTMADDSLLQVHRNGLRHIKRGPKITEWTAPGRRAILRASANEHQVVIALAGGELVCFELDQFGSLNEVNKKGVGQDVASLTIGPIPEGRVNSRFLAVGMQDKTVLVLSLEQGDKLGILARQLCSSDIEDLGMLQMEDGSPQGELTNVLFVGLRNGVLLRCTIDAQTGEIAETRSRFCGTRPCKLVRVTANGKPAMCVLSSRTWVAHTYQSRYQFIPLGSEPFEHLAPFASEQCPEGVVTVRQSQVKILSFERFGETFSKTTVPLKATPRAFVEHPLYHTLIILETDHRAYTDAEKNEIRQRLKQSLIDEDDPEERAKLAAAGEELPERDFGTITAQQGHWRSYIRVWDTQTQETTDLIELEENQAAFSLTTSVFQDTGGEVHLVVGTVKDLVPSPRSFHSGLLLTFRFRNEGRLLDLVHKTVITGGIPYAMHPFQGKLLVGVGNLLRLYSLGRRRLLRKCENRQIPNQVVKIQSEGSRIFVGDMNQSVFFLRYKKAENLLTIFADDTLPRWTSELCVLDPCTVAVADKFGNVSVLRLGPSVSEEIDNDPGVVDGQNKWLWDRGFLNGAPQKADCIASVHVGGLVTSLNKITLTPGSTDVLLYATIGGMIGVLLPLSSKRDVEMLRLLEMHLRQEYPPLGGRDHMSYRSYYGPVKAVVDGDFCEGFSSLPFQTQSDIAAELTSTPAEIKKRLEEIRNKIL